MAETYVSHWLGRGRVQRTTTLTRQTDGLEELFRLYDEDATELLLIRHAEPEKVSCGGTDKNDDQPLSVRGIEQAKRLAERVSNLYVDAVYTSPELRTRWTAQIVADTLGRAPRELPQLREIESAYAPPGYLQHCQAGEAGVQEASENASSASAQDATGSFESLRMSGDSNDSLCSSESAQDDARGTASHDSPRSFANLFHNQPRWDSLPGFEASREFRLRVIQGIEGVIWFHPARRVVIVTHSSVINAYLSMLLDIPRDLFFLPDHASISSVRSLRDLYAVWSLNDTAHLTVGLPAVA